MNFTLRQLRYFLAVAKDGTVSGAAQALSISQSAVTEAIKNLESELGSALFERHPRGLEITQQGQQFLRHAERVLASVDDAKNAFKYMEKALQGQVKIGVTHLVAGYVLSDVLAKFRRAYRQVKIKATEDDSRYLEHLLIGGELDVAIMFHSGLTDTMALQSEVLSVSPYRLWLPAGHRLLTQSAISMPDLAHEPMIMLRTDEVENIVHRELSKFGLRPNPLFRTRSVEAVRSLVATGSGIALMPDMVFRSWSLEGDRIISRDVSGVLPMVQVSIVWRKGTPLSPAADAFIATARHTALR